MCFMAMPPRHFPQDNRTIISSNGEHQYKTVAEFIFDNYVAIIDYIDVLCGSK